jgi:MFS family permease
MALILLLPIAWALSTSLWVLLLNEVVAGIAWAGAEIAIGALLFTAHSDANRRAELVGYFNPVAAACIVAGTVIGTALIDLVPPIAGSRYHTIFLLSLLLRLPGLYLALRWLPGLRAIRPGEGGSLVRTLPGVELVSAFGRGLATLFRRPID